MLLKRCQKPAAALMKKPAWMKQLGNVEEEASSSQEEDEEKRPSMRQAAIRKKAMPWRGPPAAGEVKFVTREPG